MAHVRTAVPVRQSSLREHNLALVLKHVAGRHPVSRADIAQATGLTRATVSALVEDLIDGQLVMEVAGAPKAGAGRPSIGLDLDPAGPAGLGLQVNVDYLAACVVDMTGAVRHREVRHGDQRKRASDEVLADVAALAATGTCVAEGLGLRLAGAALAVPGLVQDRTLRLAPNLGWRDLTVGLRVADQPVRVDNDANLAALGEMFTNPNAGRSFIYVCGEIGIGGGVVVGGELLRGSRGFGGEIGHMSVHPSGPLCRCGAHGCLEQYAGQEAMLRAAGLADPGAGASAATDLAAGAIAGNRKVLAAIDAAGAALGVVLADTVNLIDVDTVILGGIYTRLEPWLRRNIAREIGARVLASDWAPVQIRPSVLADNASVIGAAASVVRSVWDNPAAWLQSR
jgi:predicted NBD/HSP70 family sugar kinase